MLRTAIAALAIVYGGASQALTVYHTDIDDLINAPIAFGESGDILPGSAFTDRLFGGSQDVFVTVSFAAVGTPSVWDQVRFGVGTASQDYSLGSTGPTGIVGPTVNYVQTFRVTASNELFITFDLNNIKGGYEYSVEANAVPLPPSLALLGSGVALIGAAQLRRKRRKAEA